MLCHGPRPGYCEPIATINSIDDSHFKGPRPECWEPLVTINIKSDSIVDAKWGALLPPSLITAVSAVEHTLKSFRNDWELINCFDTLLHGNHLIKR